MRDGWPIKCDQTQGVLGLKVHNPIIISVKKYDKMLVTSGLWYDISIVKNIMEGKISINGNGHAIKQKWA